MLARLFIDTDHNARFAVTDQNGDPVATATVTARLTDVAGVDVPGVAWPVVAPHDAGGVYEIALPADMDLEAGERYYLVVRSEAAGVRAKVTGTFVAEERDDG